MARRTIVLLAAVSLFMGMLPAAAQLSSNGYSPRSVDGGSTTGLANNPDELAHVIIQLTTPPVSRVVANRLAATGSKPSQADRAAAARAVLQQQDVMRRVLSPMIAEEISSFQVALNGFRAKVRYGDLEALRRTPGVAKVTFAVKHERTHTNTMPFIGAPAVWGGVPGHTGEGVIVAVIDSGVDYHHANLGGSGDPEDFANDPRTSIPAAGFPNTKVIGGIDLVGDDYDAEDNPAVPDPNPLDCLGGDAGGHGSHVAGTIAGYGVNRDGSRYMGPYDETTFENDFRIGPGVAPGAQIFAIRVFGCSGPTEFVEDAIEVALDPDGDPETDDAVDIINMSLGSGYGEPDDTSATAAQNAVAAGVIVVASSGNSGDLPYITGSPAAAPGVISVAGNTAPGEIETMGIRLNAPEADFFQPEDYEDFFASGRGTCTGWEIRNNFNLFDGGPFTITIMDEDANILTSDLAEEDVFAVEDDDPESLQRTFQWFRNPGPGFPAAGPTRDLTLTRDLTGCDTAGVYAAVEAAFSNPLWQHGPLTEDIVVGEPFEGCSALTNAAEVAGKIVLLSRGTCAFVDKYVNAQDAGAVGLVVVNNAAGPAITMGGDYSGEANIPAVMISQADAAVWLGAIDDGDTLNATMDPDLMGPPIPLAPNQVYSSSSRGPSRENQGFKPDVTAPAVGVMSTAVGTGGRGAAFNGTSMAAPHVSGVAALLREALPDADVAQVKSMIQNSAAPIAPANTPAARQGTGMVRADVAVSAVAYTDMGGLAFGRLNPVTADETTQTVTVIDLSGEGGTFDITVEPLGSAPGVTVTAPSSVNVPADGSATFDVTISLDPAAMTEDDAFQSHEDAGGRIILSSGDDELVVGYNAVIDPASNAAISDGGTAFVVDNDSDHWTPAFVFSGANSTDGDGVLGVAGGQASETLGFFGIALEQPWDATSPMVIDLYLDVDQDGTFDYLIEAADLGLLQGGGYAGAYASAVINLGAGTGTITHFVEIDFNDTVAGLTAPLSMLSGIGGDVDFFLDVWDIRSGETWAEGEGTFTFDAAGYLGIEADDMFTGGDVAPFSNAGAMWLFPNNTLDTQTQMVTPIEDTVGAFDPNTGQWHLRDSSGDVTSFYFGAPGDRPLMGDWDGDGVDTVGVYRPSNQTVYLRNSNSTGTAESSFVIGNPGDIALAGDWDGDGMDTVSVYRPTTGQVFIVNSISVITVDADYYFGIPGDKPFAGDFDADGVDTIGLHRESSGLVYFTNQHATTFAEFEFFFGIPNDRLVAGDWGIVDLVDTPAVFRPSNTTWYFRHTNTQGFADTEFVWGSAHWLPVAGNFGLD